MTNNFHRIGTATRSIFDRENILKPGPGQYEPKFNKTAPAYRLVSLRNFEFKFF